MFLYRIDIEVSVNLYDWNVIIQFPMQLLISYVGQLGRQVSLSGHILILHCMNSF